MQQSARQHMQSDKKEKKAKFLNVFSIAVLI